MSRAWLRQFADAALECKLGAVVRLLPECGSFALQQCDEGLDELDVTIAAIERSDLNAFSYLDEEAAHEAAADADLDAPFGGVPVGVKELDSVAGWPYTQASVPLQDEVATHDSAPGIRTQLSDDVRGFCASAAARLDVAMVATRSATPKRRRVGSKERFACPAGGGRLREPPGAPDKLL